MDFFRLNNNNLEEIVFNMRELNTIFKKKQAKYKTGFSIPSDIGYCHLETELKGNIYISKHSSFYHKNILRSSKNGVENIAIYFMKKGKPSCSIDHKKGTHHYFRANTSGVCFMQEEYDFTEYTVKNDLNESVGLHIPLPYFKHLCNLYPELFAPSFIRYQKGESFFLKEQFTTTTPEMHHILSQIENSSLMGNGQNAYVDAKVLEILILQFQTPNTTDEDYKIKEKNKIEEAAYILLSDIHHPPSIRDLSLQVGINEKKLKQGFKQVFNTTIYGYLFEYKMNLALHLLRENTYNITEISFRCGYNYPSHFCTAFKRKFGVSPLEKKKLNICKN